MTDEERYKIAKKRVKAKKEFYSHLTTFLVMGGFFLTLNLITSPRAMWWYWPMLGWGIGVAMHGLKVFGLPGSGAGGTDWEEREIQKEMDRMDPNNSRSGSSVDIDKRLELQEAKKGDSSYRKDDLV